MSPFWNSEDAVGEHGESGAVAVVDEEAVAVLKLFCRRADVVSEVDRLLVDE